MKELQELGIMALAWLIVALAAGLICLILWRLLPPSERRLFPWPRWRFVAWLGVDVWMVFFLVIFFVPGAVYKVLDQSGFFTLIYGAAANSEALRDRKMFLWTPAFALPFQMAMTLAWLASVRGVRATDVGLSRRRLPQNVVAGYLTWLAVTPLTLLLYWALTLLLEVAPHPAERLIKSPLVTLDWVAFGFAVLVAAPVIEELVFRGVLLPWQTSRGLDAQLVIGVTALAMAIYGGISAEGTFNVAPLIFVLLMFPGYVVVPYLHRRWRSRKLRQAAERGTPERAEDTDVVSVADAGLWQRLSNAALAFVIMASERRVNVLLALYGNALLFAAFHSGVWPSPIPLFMLAFGLAWLAHRTQSLIGPIVVHALFNGVSFVQSLLTQ